MKSYLIVFVGAGLGGALRHAVNIAAVHLPLLGLASGTLLVNACGSFAIGLLAGYFALRGDPGQEWRLFLTTGLLGGFTTFSAFSLDAALLYQRGALMPAALYVTGSVVVCLGAVFAGLAVARFIGP